MAYNASFDDSYAYRKSKADSSKRRRQILAERAAEDRERKRQDPNYITENEKINMARHHVMFDTRTLRVKPFERFFNR